MSGRAALVATLLLAAGCAGDGACPAERAASAEIGLGDLATGFSPMSDGTEVPIVLGPQGLNMIVVSVRAVDLAPSADGAHPLAVGVYHGGEVVAGAIGTLEPVPAEDGSAADFLGLRVVFTLSEVRPLDGQPAEVQATITDGCSQPVLATRTVTLTL